MRYVQRGIEPKGLKGIRRRYTKRWIDCYKYGISGPPTDRKWRNFVDELRDSFSSCCGYCEIICKGEVDHFRPKKKFPELVYEWDNWVFACHDCNNFKGESWSSIGFSDPCSMDSFCDESRCCFIFDLKTGQVLPHPQLSVDNRKRAEATIRILRLNGTFRLKVRLEHVRRLENLLDLSQYDTDNAAEEFAYLALPGSQFSSLTKYFVKVKMS